MCVLVLLFVNMGSETQTNTNFVLILAQFAVNLAQKTMKRVGKIMPSSDCDVRIHPSFSTKFPQENQLSFFLEIVNQKQGLSCVLLPV